MPVSFYSAFLGAIGSIVGHSYIAFSRHDRKYSQSLSELAAADNSTLKQFRWIALTNSTLLAVTVYWFIAPRNNYGLAQSLAWSVEYIGGILMLIFPARNRSLALHNFFAMSMAVGMYSLAFMFLPILGGFFLILVLICIFGMTIFGITTFFDKKRYLVHELGFIFLSHVTICIAALGLLIV